MIFTRKNTTELVKVLKMSEPYTMEAVHIKYEQLMNTPEANLTPEQIEMKNKAFAVVQEHDNAVGRKRTKGNPNE